MGHVVAVSLERGEEGVEAELGVGGYVEDCDGLQLLLWGMKRGCDYDVGAVGYGDEVDGVGAEVRTAG